MAKPHGGVLVENFLTKGEEEAIRERLPNLKKLILDEVEISDIELLANGAFSPLTGFLNQADYLSILSENRLSSGLVWTIPIVLSVTLEKANNYREGDTIALVSRHAKFLGILLLAEKYPRQKETEAQKVYGTTDLDHPGVANLYQKGDVILSGRVKVIQGIFEKEITKYSLTPSQTRTEFSSRGWKTIVAFQTRNPIHRAHEYLQKVALEMVDGLLIHPLVGFTKADDIPADIRMDCYQELLNKYYPSSRVMLSVFPAAMRYAGPKEAVFHAIVRKNYGCTHFIVGRDHAGVGNYYGTYDAQRIFDQFTPEEIGITILKFENTFYCKKCRNMASAKTCPHQGQDLLFLSGTKVREMLHDGILLPEEFTRPEVANILMNYYQSQI